MPGDLDVLCLGAGVKIYLLYVHDDRYSVPALDSVQAESEAQARALASERLSSSQHYHAVEVWDEDRLICKLDADADVPER